MVPVGVLFVFKIKKPKFVRELYGYSDKSNFGRYNYKRDGLLSRLKHTKPSKSAVIVKREEAHVLRSFLKKCNAPFTERLVILDPKEAKRLGIPHHNKWERIIEDLKGSKDLLITVEV